MKYILSIILIITIGLNLYSQNLRNPVDNSGNGLSNLISDWGPRNFTGGSRFHAGLDYSCRSDNNNRDRAYALEGGTPLTFTPNGDASNITVGNWVYMHVLVDSTGNNNWTLKNPVCGNRVILETLGANGQTKIFVNTDNQLFLGVERISKWGTPAITTRTVAANDVVFRPNNLNHLHLQTTEMGNWVNPLTYIAYNGSNANDMDLDLRMKYNNGGTATEFPSYNQMFNVVYGDEVIAESDVNYVGEYDLNVTRVEAKKTGENYETIAEWKYSGTNHLTFSSRYNGIGTSTYYNSYPQGSDSQTRSLNTILDDPREGMHPVRTGSSTNQLGRDILKRHWNTQQGWNTNTPAYPDGEYILRLTTEDVRGNSKSITQTNVIDNFRPYIKKVEVRKGSVNGDLVYSGMWQWNSGNLQSTISGNGCITTDLVWVHVYPSESMSNVEIKVNGTTCNSLSSSTDSHWVFKVNAGILSTNNSITINENSSDLAGNKLYGFLDGNNLVSGNSIPKRTNTGTWSSNISQNDNYHKFGAYHPPVDMVANFTASTQTASSGTTIHFYDASSGDPTNHSWSFPGGSPSTSTLQNPVVTYANVGTYDVTLSVSGNGQSDTETKTNYVSIEMNEFDIYGSVVEFYGNHSAIQGVSVEFIPNSNSEGDESGTITTDNNGEFTFSVSEGWQGDVLFSKDGYANVSRTIGDMNSNYSLGEIMMQIVALDFTYEHTDETSQCVDVDIQTNVPFDHAYFYWTEPLSGGYSALTYTRSHLLCFNDCVNGETYSNNVLLCLYDSENNQIGSCVEKNISFYFEPVNMECYNVDIQADYEIENGGNVFPLGTTVKFNNTSYPQECVMTSVWWFDNDNAWDDCSFWDTHFNCAASCKYDTLHEHTCTGVVYPDPYYVEYQYNSKGNKVIHLFTSSACNAREIALGCNEQGNGFTDSEKWGSVVIVDCDETINYSSNLTSAVVTEYGSTKQYYSGSFILNSQITYPPNNNRLEFIACNNIKMTSGFKLVSTGKAIKMYIHNNLSVGNQSQNNLKSLVVSENDEINRQSNNKKGLYDFRVNLYPNPVSDYLNVDIVGVDFQKVSRLIIFDVSGKIVKRINPLDIEGRIDVSELMQGSYVLSVQLDDDVISQKFIKK